MHNRLLNATSVFDDHYQYRPLIHNRLVSFCHIHVLVCFMYMYMTLSLPAVECGASGPGEGLSSTVQPGQRVGQSAS